MLMIMDSSPGTDWICRSDFIGRGREKLYCIEQLRCSIQYKKLPFPQKNELGFVTQAAGRGVRGVG